MTASEYLGAYSGKIIEIDLRTGESWIGMIVSASGTISIVQPEALYIDFNRILDIEEHKQMGFRYDYKHEIISPENIKKITVLEGNIT